ncbi:NADH-quinone oxidoreductase subunit C [Streptomyces sp. 7-21]|uniref:NADH-quinone oxidoreductase subunit C n=1 Tax=Streptomyces sp. 7-21 TaxID=2802283 RepID=UPI00192015B9|nr:NADH-quinone oxidoreductase subunit C [Streptomyces sp. 7-21]MBL1065518.1 NADH-quinone oxidoreductase subunit C [Streptomyces sp. 7-21]
MTEAGWLPRPAEEIFGDGARAEEAYGLLTVDVEPGEGWTRALRAARDDLGCTFFDWLSAVDEPGTGLRVCAHVVALPGVRRLLLRTTVPRDGGSLPTATGVYAGAAWHERETHEMFGVGFDGHPGLEPLLLPEGFEGHPLRKDFVLAARVAKAWPGAKEPGEPSHGGPRRRQMLPPGVPDPNEWGPLKGQLPAAPAARRRAGAAGGTRPARPRRNRSASEGSASQRAAATGPAEPGAPAPRPRRNRSASEGSASQRAAASRPAAPSRGRNQDTPWQRAAGAETDAGAPAQPAPQPGTGEGPAPARRRNQPAGEGPAGPRDEPAAGPAGSGPEHREDQADRDGGPGRGPGSGRQDDEAGDAGAQDAGPGDGAGGEGGG